MYRARTVLVMVAALTGCGQSTAPAEPLVVTVQASAATISVGDTLSVVVNATGNNLVGVFIEYGDAEADQYAMSGATSARVTFKHAFETAGTFTIRAVVTDAIAGDKEATVAVAVH